MSGADPLDELLARLEARVGLRADRTGRARLVEALARMAGGGRHGAAGTLAARARADEGLFDALVAEVTVGESSFFRHREQLAVLRGSILPALAHSRPVHVWSAGCARGEEPYTLAMLMQEAGLAARIVATDVSRRALADAARARYRSWALRSTTEAERARWFAREGDEYRVREPVRRAVRFEHANLLDPPPVRGVQLAVCRNVLIYLAPAAIARAAAHLRDALAPGGWLLTGPSDPRLEADGLRAVATGAGIAYTTGDPSPPVRPAARRPAPAPPAPVPAPAPTPASAAAATAAGEREVVMSRARSLADRGLDHEALALLGEGLASWPLDPELRCVQGLVHLAAGRLDEAAGALAAARYLEPGLPAAHLLLARVDGARGRPRAAARSVATARRLLAALPAAAPVPPLDEPAGRLAELLAGGSRARPAGAGP